LLAAHQGRPGERGPSGNPFPKAEPKPTHVVFFLDAKTARGGETCSARVLSRRAHSRRRAARYLAATRHDSRRCLGWHCGVCAQDFVYCGGATAYSLSRHAVATATKSCGSIFFHREGMQVAATAATGTPSRSAQQLAAGLGPHRPPVRRPGRRFTRGLASRHPSRDTGSVCNTTTCDDRLDPCVPDNRGALELDSCSRPCDAGTPLPQSLARPSRDQKVSEPTPSRVLTRSPARGSE